MANNTAKKRSFPNPYNGAKRGFPNPYGSRKEPLKSIPVYNKKRSVKFPK